MSAPVSPSPAAAGDSAGATGADPAAAPARPSLPRLGGLVLRSAVAPGSTHLATGRRRSGWAILALALLVLAAAVAVAGYALTHPEEAAGWSVRTDLLTLLKWAVVGVAVAWVLVVLRSAALARPGRRGWSGRALATVLALGLTAAIALPAAVVVRDTDAQLHFVTSVFHERPSSRRVAPTTPDAPLNGGRLNVLLAGSDAGPDRTGVRTDTVILASIDTRTGRTVLFTLPRNMERVPFAPGSAMAKQFPRGFDCGNECLLNAVYAYAVEHPALFPGDPDPGMTALVSAVTATLGLPVDYHAIVDLAGFQKIVDALGGVTLRVDRRLPIGGLDAVGHHVAPSGYIQPGLQHMDGFTALWYARSRSDSSDYERVQRQRCLLGAIQRQADPQNLLANFQQVASSAADALQTDIPRDLLPDLVKLAFTVKKTPVEGLAFTPPLVEPARPDFAAVRADVQAALAAPAPSAPAPSAGPTVTPSSGAAAIPTTPPATGPPPTAPVSVSQVCSYS